MTIYRPPDGYPPLDALAPCLTQDSATAGPPALAASRVYQYGQSQLRSPRVHLVFEETYPHAELFLQWRLYHGLANLVSGSFAMGLAQYGAGPGAYAGGDVNGIYGFTHVSWYHGSVIGRRLRGEPAVADHDAIPTAALLERLRRDPEAPWGDYGPSGLTAMKLGKLLRGYDIHSPNIRFCLFYPSDAAAYH